MPGRDVIASPVLVGRDDVLARADRRLSQTATGRGHLLLMSGEAGIGKTRLLHSISRRAERADFAVARAAAFRGDAEDSGGVLLDLASSLRRNADPSAQAVGRALAGRLRAPVTGEGDPHRQRRLLVQDLVDQLSDLDPAKRWLIVLEDLHWADELSLEVVAHLAARLAIRSTFILGAYRSDELFPGTPMRDWRTRLVSQRLAEEVRLSRLPLEQTAILTSSLLSRPASAQLVAAIQTRTDGIPLHIEELLAGADDDALELLAREGGTDIDVPQSLADAVLLRVNTLDSCSRDIAGAAAVIGRSFDFDLLTEVTEADDDTVDRCLRALRSTYLIQAGGAPDSFDFRHALIRDALYADIPLPRRRRLHERVAVVAAERGYRDAFVSAHFELAGIPDAAHRHAMRAAVEASSVSAHREALRLYRRSLDNRPADQSSHDHARLLALLGTEAAAVDENAVAAEAFGLAHAEWKQAGDLVHAAAVVPPMVAVSHLLGHPLETRVRLLESALADVRGVDGAGPVETQLLGALAAAYMLNRELDHAIAYGERSQALSRSIGHDEAGLNTAATLGSVLVFAGQHESGWTLLEDSVSRSVDRYLESEAARGYRMLGTTASVVVEYDRAVQWLDRGIEYADGAELWNHRSYMAAHRAHVHWARGEWTAAQQTAEQALADGRGGITTRITALYVLGYLAMGRGQFATATALLSEALEAGTPMGELQRISPALWGLAETAQLQGDFEQAIMLCENGFAASNRVMDAAYLYPFLVTGARAHLAQCDPQAAEEWVDRVERVLLRRSIPGTMPAIDHARGLLQLAAGDRCAGTASLERARVSWAARHRFWEGSWAALEVARGTAPGDCGSAPGLIDEVRSRADGIGATPLVTAADAVRQRATATDPWHPLTAREFSVANLVSAGMTNREIATELFVSPRTVSAHVEHILTKLGAGRRAEIAAWAARIGA